MMRIVMATLLVSAVWPAISAQASTYYSFDDNGTIYVGKVNHGGTTSMWLCDDGPSPSDANWQNLGNGSGLTANWLVHGDDSTAGCSGTCSDTIEILRGTRTISGEVGHPAAPIQATRRSSPVRQSK
jgi:hypothetical protein